jgi:hypothetical protein
MPADIKKDLEAAAKPAPAASPSKPENKQAISNVKSLPSWRDQSADRPSLGGTLNATTQEAEVEKRQEADAESNKVLLNHGSGSNGGLNANQPDYKEDDEPEFIDPMEDSKPPSEIKPAASSDKTKTSPTLADLEAQVQAHAGDKSQSGGAEDARKAVESVIDSMPFDPAHHPDASIGAQAMPSLDHSSSLPLPPPPPLPDFSQLPPPPELAPQNPPASSQSLPPPPTNNTANTNSANNIPPPVSGNDPTQFRIPGQ